jgi:DNA-binding GntR family transcriptional regulator
MKENRTKPPAGSGNAATPTGASLATIAYEAVIEQIMSGQLRSNDVIQEGRLASDLGLSRTPLREAMGRLEGEGLIVRSGRTLMVQGLSLTDFLEILHLRRLLEGEAVALAVRNMSQEKLQELRDAVEALDEATITPEAHWALDDDIHISIASASNSKLLAQTVADLRRKTRLFNLKKIPSRLYPGKAEHLRILDALIKRDRDEAVEAMREHLDNAKTAILKTLQHLD